MSEQKTNKTWQLWFMIDLTIDDLTRRLNKFPDHNLISRENR